MYQSIIVGAGPSGLQCATVLAFDGRKVLLLDEGPAGGLILQSPLIQNVSGFAHGFAGDEWADEAVTQARASGVRLQVGSEQHHVTSITRDWQGVFTVRTSGNQYRSLSVVMATGCTGRPLPIPGAMLEHVHYALAPHSDIEGGRKVVVIGGSNSAGTAAMHLGEMGNSVTILYRGQLHISQGIIDQLSNGTNFARAEVLEIAKAGRTLLVYTSEGPIASVDDVYVMAGRKPYTVYGDALVHTDSDGFVYGDLYTGRTDCTGLYAIGTLVRNSVRTMGAALGSGVTAAYNVGAYLSERGE